MIFSKACQTMACTTCQKDIVDCKIAPTTFSLNFTKFLHFAAAENILCGISSTANHPSHTKGKKKTKYKCYILCFEKDYYLQIMIADKNSIIYCTPVLGQDPG